MTVIDTGPFGEDDLDEGSAADHIHGICLKNGPPQRIGVELEWLVRDARDPALPVPAGRIAAAVAAFGATTEDRDAEGGARDGQCEDGDRGSRTRGWSGEPQAGPGRAGCGRSGHGRAAPRPAQAWGSGARPPESG